MTTTYDTDHRPGAIVGGLLPDGREWLIYPMIFTYRLTVGDPADVGRYDDFWCYHTLKDAMIAVTNWDGTGEPDGWHKTAGRKRPDGTAASEVPDR